MQFKVAIKGIQIALFTSLAIAVVSLPRWETVGALIITALWIVASELVDRNQVIEAEAIKKRLSEAEQAIRTLEVKLNDSKFLSAIQRQTR